MAFSFQKNCRILQILIKKYQVAYPAPKFQKLPSVFGCFIFTTKYQYAKSGDPKTIPPATTSFSSREKDKLTYEKKAGKSYSSPHSLNLFAAGASRKRSSLQKMLANVENPAISSKIALQPPEEPLSAEEWEKLKAESKEVNDFEHFMLSQMIVCNSPIEVAKSLLAAVANRDGDVSYALLVKYLVLCLSQKQTKEINEVYEVMRARFKTFDPSCSTLFIKSFSQSERWREALRILEDMKRILMPSKNNYGDCIFGALINQEKHLACELFHEMTANNIIPNLDVLQFFFESGKGTKDDYFKSQLIQILFYLRNNEIYPGEALMLSIKEWFESLPGESWKGSLTTIRNSGQCPSCNQTLESINLSPEEYSILKEKIIKDVIKGTDIFRKTTPKELEEFQKFVNQHSPFDIVIDGLNVGKTFTKYYPSQILMDVVDHLSEQNQRMLILGRKHMQHNSHQWKNNHMAAMQKKANFFFTDNVSEDDPFVLCATLHSGNHCRFLTRDLLRDHKACLSDSHTKRLFFKWQRGHQMVLSKYIPGKIVKFEHILQYDTIVQTKGKTWHIPYDDKFSERSSYEVPTKWLCLQQDNAFSTN